MRAYDHTSRKIIRNAQYVILLGGLIASFTVFVFAYRDNNMQALALREAVYAADKAGTDVETPLRELRSYTYAHMNAGLAGGEGAVYPPIQLKYRYEALVAAEKKRVADANAQTLRDANIRCDIPSVARIYASRDKCIEIYLGAHKLEVEQAIPDALYKFDFVAPWWSPDRAGWAAVATIVFGLLLVLRVAASLWMRAALRH